MPELLDFSKAIKDVLRGDKEQFRHIIKACNQPLYRTALVILKNPADAQDAVQSAYLKAYTHLDTFRGDSAFLTWITRILINECKMMLRRRKQTSTLEQDEVRSKQSLNEDAVDTMHKNQIKGILESAVLDLPEKYRMVYVVREVNDFSTQKTAAMLGISEENVKIRLHRAKAIIRENLLQQVDVKELFPFGNEHCDLLTERVMQLIYSMHRTPRAVIG